MSYVSVPYVFNSTGMYLFELGGYDQVYVKVRGKSILPMALPARPASMLASFLGFVVFIYWLRHRRTKTVVDEETLKRFLADGSTLESLIKEYGVLYVPGSGNLKFQNLFFIDLSEKDMRYAEELSDQYGISLTAAKALSLSVRLHARNIVMISDLPDELETIFRGAKIKKPTLKTLNGIH